MGGGGVQEERRLAAAPTGAPTAARLATRSSRLERELLVGGALERQPMQRRDALALDRVAVLWRGVADVGAELPAGMQRVGTMHEAITRHLGDDRSGRDGGARAVPVHDRALLVNTLLWMISVLLIIYGT